MMQQAATPEVGYYWIADRFGPPPGIPRARKEELDCMTDAEYLEAFRQMTQEEKDCLMASEAERRRTFAVHWPISLVANPKDCAKAGLYSIGFADWAQCAFCGGILKNWENGDIPKAKHKKLFKHCRMIQRKPCGNIPVDMKLQSEFGTGIALSSQLLAALTTPEELNIDTVRPKHPAMATVRTRTNTYENYPCGSSIEVDKLCDAGFIYEGIGDKVKCFWCDGALEMWSRGDDPWTEHAKWYPGCTYVQQTKGLDFIRKARSQMAPDDLAKAENTYYNKGDVSFLERAMTGLQCDNVKSYFGYQFSLNLEFPEDLIKTAYEANDNEEFEDVTELITIMQDLYGGNSIYLDKCKHKTAQKRLEKFTSQDKEDGGEMPLQLSRRIDVPAIVTSISEFNEEQSRTLNSAMECRLCQSNMSGALLLPCGCFCICQGCTRKELPEYCPICYTEVKAASRAFLG